MDKLGRRKGAGERALFSCGVGGPRARRRKGRSAARAVLALLSLSVAFFLILPGCGSGTGALSEEEQVAERALRSAFAGDGEAFLRLVDPSFVRGAREEMPDADDETLGVILLSGFLQDIPYSGMPRPRYQVEQEGERAVVHVWGSFLDAEGREVEVAEEEALRVPLLREGGRWYLDLLDM